MGTRRIAGVIVACVLPVATASCVLFDERSAAEGIEHRIHDMPGVSTTSLTYNSGIAVGKNFSLSVTLDASATGQQAIDVGTEFVRERLAAGLDDHVGSLTLEYPAAEDTGDVVFDASRAAFDFGPNDGEPDPGERQVADGIGVWRELTQAPVVNYVRLFEPGGPDGPNIRVVLRLGAEAGPARELQHATPALASASWEYALPYGSQVDRRSYVSTPAPPSDSDMALWTELSAIIGPYYTAKGYTGPMADGRQALTAIDIEAYGTHPDTLAAVPRIARAAAAALPRFGHPAELRVRGSNETIELVVGGCYRHREDHVVSPVETELSQQYERC